jgi:hypothetical protein
MASYAHPSTADRWSRRRLTAVVAVVVVLAVVAAGLLASRVLGARSAGTVAPPSGPSAYVAAGGLQFSIELPPGPYFLSELLAVQLTLANHGQTSYRVDGDPRPSYCFSALWVGLSGGQPPTYRWPTFPYRSCTAPATTLSPGQHWSFVQFFPLTSSGRVTLSAQATFLTTVSSAPGGTVVTGGVGPFTYGWPALTIQVAPQVPANRAIALAGANGRLRIAAPPGARTHLYYLYIVTCAEGGGTGYSESSAYWKPIASMELAEPSCPGTQERWQYSVAAPGYATASGEQGGP